MLKNKNSLPNFTRKVEIPQLYTLNYNENTLFEQDNKAISP